ncbi:MAG: TIM barrel protein [Deltaproteobacteria bacterium]|jgi:sugar phosphate isomerase/epimerase|nr:TIM barrel protein [Deltaproteobacteria bacterium]
MKDEPLYSISLAQWSLHRTIFANKMDPLDFPRAAREDFGIDAVEYVNGCFSRQYDSLSYLPELKQRSIDAGVRNLLIMIDGEGRLGDPDEGRRIKAVENHYKWVEASRELGGHSIRVNAWSEGDLQTQHDLVVDGLSRLCAFGAEHDINVIVENHGGLSSNGAWLSSVIAAVGSDYCGTLPDFGNFLVKRSSETADGEEVRYDRYTGVAELMPYAKAVSAKSHRFDRTGEETGTDFERMMRIVLESGYRGYVGIEFEGDVLNEQDGVHATKALLEKVRRALEEDPAFDPAATPS